MLPLHLEISDLARILPAKRRKENAFDVENFLQENGKKEKGI